MNISKTYLKRETRIYLKLVFARKEDGTEGREVIVDTKPCIKVQDGKDWFCFKKSRGGQSKIEIDNIKVNNLKTIRRTFKLSKSINDYCRKPIRCDVGALAITENMPELRHLQLSGHRITEVGLQGILDNCPHLEYLKIWLYVANLEPDLVNRLSQQIKDLRLSYLNTEKNKFADDIDYLGFSNPSEVSRRSNSEIEGHVRNIE